MKPTVKIGSLLLAVVMACSAIFASGCSFNKEWSYKTSDKELAIGVYIYCLDLAFQQGQTLAKKLDDYDATNDKWFDLEITDDDGNTAVARQWMKDKAQEMCLEFLAVEKALKDAGFWVGAASEHAQEDVWHAPMGGRLCLVMGSEGEGISRLVQEKCDFGCRLPQRGMVESLNVAQATTVLCYEWLRRTTEAAAAAAEYMNWCDTVAAGGGVMLASTSGNFANTSFGIMENSRAAIAADTYYQQQMQEGIKYWLYSLAHSNIINGLSQTTEIVPVTPSTEPEAIASMMAWE